MRREAQARVVLRSGLAGLIGGMVILSVITEGIPAQSKLDAGVVIMHKTFTRPRRRGYPLAIEATITSPAGIRTAEVFCRPRGAREFTAIPMVLQGEHRYRAVVPDWMTAGTGLEYYITATDQLGRTSSQGFVGFPLTVRLVSEQRPTREERLKALQDTLDIIRKHRQEEESRNYGDPLLDRTQ